MKRKALNSLDFANNLILIPARSGSTRVRNKNIRLLGGKPLIAYAIEEALRSKSGRVIVSTNSSQIADISLQYGAEVPFLRPEELSTETASTLSALLHALIWFKENEGWIPKMVAFRPPTSPFIKHKTIQDMFKILLGKPQINSVTTIMKPKTHPFTIVRKRHDGIIENGIITLEDKNVNDIERSQDWPEVWEGSPACRVIKKRYLENFLDNDKNHYNISKRIYDVDNCIGYEVSKIEGFDIDEEEDFTIAQLLLNTTQNQQSEKVYS